MSVGLRFANPTDGCGCFGLSDYASLIRPTVVALVLVGLRCANSTYGCGSCALLDYAALIQPAVLVPVLL
jgi:hypothetical protein